ncbi:MAG: hypothetical protein VYB54_13365 [Pseudomonadota bacterium]|nr:hypothetical protein [Pseudomonadota bacterium]
MAALPPPTPVPGSPDRPITELVGLGDADIAARMGEPHSVLRQPPATVWRYRLNGCVVDLFLFRDVQSDRLKSLSFAVARTPEAADRELDPRCTDAARSRTDG